MCLWASVADCSFVVLVLAAMTISKVNDSNGHTSNNAEPLWSQPLQLWPEYMIDVISGLSFGLTICISLIIGANRSGYHLNVPRLKITRETSHVVWLWRELYIIDNMDHCHYSIQSQFFRLLCLGILLRTQ